MKAPDRRYLTIVVATSASNFFMTRTCPRPSAATGGNGFIVISSDRYLSRGLQDLRDFEDRLLAGHSLPAKDRRVHPARLDLHGIHAAPELLPGDDLRPRPGERLVTHLARLGVVAHGDLEQLGRLLRQVNRLARVLRDLPHAGLVLLAVPDRDVPLHPAVEAGLVRPVVHPAAGHHETRLLPNDLAVHQDLRVLQGGSEHLVQLARWVPNVDADALCQDRHRRAKDVVEELAELPGREVVVLDVPPPFLRVPEPG